MARDAGYDAADEYNDNNDGACDRESVLGGLVFVQYDGSIAILLEQCAARILRAPGMLTRSCIRHSITQPAVVLYITHASASACRAGQDNLPRAYAHTGTLLPILYGQRAPTHLLVSLLGSRMDLSSASLSSASVFLCSPALKLWACGSIAKT